MARGPHLEGDLAIFPPMKWKTGPRWLPGAHEKLGGVTIQLGICRYGGLPEVPRLFKSVFVRGGIEGAVDINGIDA